MGGKPSKGTSKDMRLSRNKPTSIPQKSMPAQKQTKQQTNKGKGGY